MTVIFISVCKNKGKKDNEWESIKTRNIDLLQSFHRNGNRITASIITRTSSITINNKVEAAIPVLSLKTVFANCINSINWGIMIGKPSIAIIAAFCCALAAIAERNVNTRLRLHPPSIIS